MNWSSQTIFPSKTRSIWMTREMNLIYLSLIDFLQKLYIDLRFCYKHFKLVHCKPIISSISCPAVVSSIYPKSDLSVHVYICSSPSLVYGTMATFLKSCYWLFCSLLAACNLPINWLWFRSIRYQGNFKCSWVPGHQEGAKYIGYC